MAEDEVKPSLLSVDSAPLAVEDELDGLSSLSVDEGGPDDGGDPVGCGNAVGGP